MRGAMYTGEAHAVEKMRKRAATIRRRMMLVWEDQPGPNLTWTRVFKATTGTTQAARSGMTAAKRPTS